MVMKIMAFTLWLFFDDDDDDGVDDDLSKVGSASFFPETLFSLFAQVALWERKLCA
jgi:hypothetical protein